jgi:hypothetical protein
MGTREPWTLISPVVVCLRLTEQPESTYRGGDVEGTADVAAVRATGGEVMKEEWGGEAGGRFEGAC